MNEREVQTWLKWHRNGEQKISRVGLCPIRFYLPFGLLVVMKRANEVPAGRVDSSNDFLSNGFVTDAEARAASLLIGRNQDTSKPSTFGLIDGELVVVDYGFILPPPSSHS